MSDLPPVREAFKIIENMIEAGNFDVDEKCAFFNAPMKVGFNSRTGNGLRITRSGNEGQILPLPAISAPIMVRWKGSEGPKQTKHTTRKPTPC